MIRLTGTLRCAPDDADTVRAALPRHLRLTQDEPNCMAFDVADVYLVSERFADRAAYEAHQVRTRASDWWQATRHMTRDLRLAGE